MLFSPAQIGGIDLKNRFVRSATWEGMASEGGEVTTSLVNLMKLLALGGVGLIITGHAYISPQGQASPWQLSVADDEKVDGLAWMVKEVHEVGGKIFLQISHAGIFSSSILDRPAPGPSNMIIENQFRKARGREMSIREIEDVIASFAKAAQRAKKAGFDGVQIHAAHGYLLSQFLSPYFNRRTDHYGGDIGGRSRLVMEVYRAIRAGVGDEFPVIIKLNCKDFLDGGMSFEDMLFVARGLEKEGIDAIEMSGGTLISGRYIPSRRGEKKGPYYEEEARKFKRHLHTPLILVGGIRDMETCRSLLKNEVCDFVALSRPLIREPALIKRWMEGDETPCVCAYDNLCFKPALKGEGLYCYASRRAIRDMYK